MATTKIYYFTWSPVPKYIQPSFQLTDHVTYLKKFKRCMSEFEIYPEFNSSGNLHYHGWYIVKDAKKWFAHLLPELKHKGFVKINEVKHTLDKSYISKDCNLMSFILDEYGIGSIPFTIKNYSSWARIVPAPTAPQECLRARARKCEIERSSSKRILIKLEESPTIGGDSDESANIYNI